MPGSGVSKNINDTYTVWMQNDDVFASMVLNGITARGLRDQLTAVIPDTPAMKPSSTPPRAPSVRQK